MGPVAWIIERARGAVASAAYVATLGSPAGLARAPLPCTCITPRCVCPRPAREGSRA